MSLTDEMMARLVCPVRRAPLRREGNWLLSDAAGIAYPIANGVPRLVPEVARAIGALDSSSRI